MEVEVSGGVSVLQVCDIYGEIFAGTQGVLSNTLIMAIFQVPSRHRPSPSSAPASRTTNLKCNKAKRDFFLLKQKP